MVLSCESLYTLTNIDAGVTVGVLEGVFVTVGVLEGDPGNDLLGVLDGDTDKLGVTLGVGSGVDTLNVYLSLLFICTFPPPDVTVIPSISR
jgi:hypothetical protein